MPYVTVPKVISEVIHPFAQGSVTVNGVQYSSIVNTVVAANEIVVESKVFNVWPFGSPGGAGLWKELEVGLTAQYQAAAANDLAVITYRWQGKNLEPPNATWIDILANTVSANHVNVWQETTVLGRIAPVAGFNSVPFEIRYVIACNHATNGMGRTKNSSYIDCKYQIA